MSVIATVAVPAPSFPLGSVVDGDDAAVTVETAVPTSEEVIPYLWVPTGVVDSAVETIEAVSAVDGVTIVDETDDHSLVKLRWNDDTNGFLESIRENDAIVTRAAGSADCWTFRIRFPSYEDLSAFYTSCLESDVRMDLVQLHEAVNPQGQSRFGLTEAQRDLVVAAFEAGYFEVPRRTTLVELGDRLGISDSAVSQRLRRGLAALIDSTVSLEPQVDSRPGASDESETEAGIATAEPDGRSDP